MTCAECIAAWLGAAPRLLPAWTAPGFWAGSPPPGIPAEARDLEAMAGILREDRDDRDSLDAGAMAALGLARTLPWLAPLADGSAGPLRPRSAWRYAFAVACVATTLAPAHAYGIWSAALCDGAARLALAARQPAQMREAAALAATERIGIETAARRLGGCAPDPLAAAVALALGLPSRDRPPSVGDAVAVAAWLLAQKRMRAPLEAVDPELDAATLRRLALTSESLVAALASLAATVERSRRLSRIALERR